MIEGLIFKCPFEDEECDCPFLDLRKLENNKKIEELQSLSEKERGKKYAHHMRCLRKREDNCKF
jgi:hypothetical protein